MKKKGSTLVYPLCPIQERLYTVGSREKGSDCSDGADASKYGACQVEAFYAYPQIASEARKTAKNMVSLPVYLCIIYIFCNVS